MSDGMFIIAMIALGASMFSFGFLMGRIFERLDHHRNGGD